MAPMATIAQSAGESNASSLSASVASGACDCRRSELGRRRRCPLTAARCRQRDVLERQAEVVERIERAEACRDGVVGEEQQGADDGEGAALVLGGGVDAAAVGIDPADLV